MEKEDTVMKEKIKLRFLINTLSGGGAEKVLINLLHQLDKEKYDISLVSISGGTYVEKIPSHIDYRCIVPCSDGKKGRLATKLIYKIPPWLFSCLFLRGNKDVEIAYLEGNPTKFIKAKKGGKKIAFVHCDFSRSDFVKVFYHGAENCVKEYEEYNKVCFVSKASKQGFQRAVGTLSNSCVIHNVIDFENIKKMMIEESTCSYTTAGLKLLAVGRLVEVKGFDRLLRVVGRLEKEFKFQLIIAGDGTEREKLETIIKEKGIESVILAGYQKNPYSLFRTADLFVCSSISEGYSTVVSEAIAIGLPVVTTDCAGMSEILDEGNFGMIIENSEQALYNALKKVLEDKKTFEHLKKMANDGQESMNFRNPIKEYDNLFDSLISRRIR